MNINKEVVKKISRLVQIKLTEKEEESIADQLDQVIKSVEVLNEVEVQELPITSQTHGLKNVFRKDEVKEGLNIENYQNNKNIYNRYFRVKKVL